jgi:murein DD-endopeptidase MepM/ murein hydrolase activator NlpD
MTARLFAAMGLACFGLLLGGGAAAAPPLLIGPPVSAQAFAVQVIAPDGTVAAATPQAEAPPPGAVPSAGFAYPFDGSIVSADSTSATVSASEVDGTAAARSELQNLALFGGEITVSEVRAAVSSAATIGDLSDSTVTNLIVFGTSVSEPTPNLEIPLADWGSMTVLRESTSQSEGFVPAWHGTVTALVVQLDREHLGLPGGSTIRIGFSDASARAPTPAGATTNTTTTTTQQASAPKSNSPKTVASGKGQPKSQKPLIATGASIGVRAGDVRRPKQKGRGLPIRTEIPVVTPKLTSGGYVFPVYGPSGYGDTFGAPRGDVSGGWHHGDDIFAPLGAPILAVANGTVFSVGWNDVGGYRLWLRDRGGNEFYYAHLSAYTTLAVNGRHVQAGDVVGFVGNTGDAEGTPFHLHFEVHPVSLLFLGYDGAVNPTKYLDAWKRVEDVRILPAVPFSTVGGAEASSAPTPGAILLQSTDISTANGLDPGSLTRAMNAAATIDVTKPSVAELPVPLPVLDRA